jgi:hypothetical protein
MLGPSTAKQMTMRITGPLHIGIVDDTTTGGRELHLSFTEAFRQLTPFEQAEQFAKYVEDLRRAVAVQGQNNEERQGLFTILSIAEELLPHVQADDLALDETVVVEIKPEFSLDSLIRSE